MSSCSQRAASVLALSIALYADGASAQPVDTLEPEFADDLTLTRVVGGFSSPTGARFLPDGRLVVIEQLGQVYVWTGTGTPTLAGTLPVAQTLGETGLLGVAVDPQFETSNRLYFYYTADNTLNNDRHRVAWALLEPGNNQLDAAGRTEIARNIYGGSNHNGGGLEFGPDGLLYAGVGDRGCNCGCEPGMNPTNYFPSCLTNVSGKIIRIGRDGEIPPDNPLVGMDAVTGCGAGTSCTLAAMIPNASVTGPPREEIWVWGLRNPWRFSFDSLTGYLWIGDVGEHSYEEITVSKRGGEHHGWPFREGAHGQPVETCTTATPNAVGPCVDPAYEYTHEGSSNPGAGSVTGGVFSNHCSWPAPYAGRYWFSDYSKQRVWMLEVNDARDGVIGDRIIVVTVVLNAVHLFVGNDGAVYYVAHADGEIWRIAPARPAVCSEDAGLPDLGGPDASSADADTTPDAAIPDAMIPDVASSGDAAGPRPPTAKDDSCSCRGVNRTNAASLAHAWSLLFALAIVRTTRRR